MEKETVKKILDEIVFQTYEKFPKLLSFFKKRNEASEKLSAIKVKSIDDLYYTSFFKIMHEADERIVSDFCNLYVDLIIQTRNHIWKIGAFNVLRTLNEQVQLYMIGRYGDEYDVVTKAIPGQSLHHYGCAVDFVFWKPEHNWSWSASRKWNIITDSAKKRSFRTISWDKCHVEKRIKEIEDLRKEVVSFVRDRMKKEGIL